jgi:glyoxalase superfamily protein
MATIKDIVVDCKNAAPLARFWAALLDDYDVRPYTDEDIASLAKEGLTPETDPVVFVDGPGPNICFQQVPETKTTKNRLHIELMSGDRATEVQSALGLGASIYYEGDGWTTLQDPEGNEFCITDA